MSENRLNGQILAYLALGCGALAFVLCVLPLLAGWFFHLLTFSKILGLAGIILGIIGIVKKQNLTFSLLGIILGVCTLLCPVIFQMAYLEKAAEYASDEVMTVFSAFEEFGD